MNRAEAEAVVRAALESDWAVGTFYIDAAFESASAWAFEYGSREFFVDGDVGLMVLNQPVAVVAKSSGALSFVTWSDAPGFLDAFEER